MSEELRRGIPKAVRTGKVTKFTEEEMQRIDEEFEIILKRNGVLKENESIKDLKKIDRRLEEL